MRQKDAAKYLRLPWTFREEGESQGSCRICGCKGTVAYKFGRQAKHSLLNIVEDVKNHFFEGILS